MATVVGTVSFISGVVYAVKADGTERLLALGDEVFADEVLRTGPQAKVEITMDNGEVVALGEQQSWLVSAESFLDADEYPVEESVINQDVASIDAIQQAILAGADPTQVAEPTAAGTPAAGDAGAVTGNEGSSFTTISRTAQEGNPEAGFDTTGPGTAQQTQTQFTPELINRAPEATPDFITTAEDTPVFDRIDATDADGDLLTYTLVSAPENGTAVINADGTYTYTPNENYNGDDAFIVRVDDGRGGVIEVPVSVVITPVNDAPNANAFQETTPEDTPISSAVFTTDVDGDTLTYSLGSGPSNGTVVINSDGTYTYTPSQDFNGNDRFFVTADDGNGGTTQIPVDIIVTPVNDAPNANAFQETTPEDTPISSAVFTTDVDGDALTYSLSSEPSNGTVVINSDGTYTYTPSQDFNGNDRFFVTADDGNGGTIQIPVDIIVTPVNDVPNENAFQETTPEDTPISSAVFTTDEDGDALTYSLSSEPSNGTVVINSDGTYTYTPGQDFNGNDRFFVTADDGNGGTTQIPVDIVVTPVNDAPTAGAFAKSTPENTAFTDLVFAQDVDGDALTYSLNTGPSNGSVSLDANGTYTYTPNNGFIGNDSFTVTASEGSGGTATIPVSIDVFPLNDAPVALADSASTQENTPVLISVTGNDSDPDGTINPSTVNIISGPSNGSLVVNSDGTVEYTPNSGYTGPDSFQYTVQDNDGATSNIATVTIGVDAPVNLPPTATDDNQGVIEDTSATINLAANDNDPDDGLDLTSIVITDQPDHGTLVVNNDGTVTYTPDSNYNGPDSFKYTIADAAGNVSNEATVNLTVTPENDPPVAVNDSGSTAEDTPVNIDLAGNDSDADDGLDLTSIVITDQPDHGTLVVNNDGTVTYTPDSNYNGPDSFKYTIADAAGNVSNEAEVSLNVVGNNNSVVATDDGGATSGFVYVGANGGSWTAQGVTVEAFNADGSAGTIVRNTSFGFGVAGTPDPDDTRKNPPQIEYDTATNTSESLVFTYDDFVTSAEVDIARLYGSESVNGNVHIEQGAWIAYVVDDSGNQRVVAGDEFSFASSSNGGTITITVPPGYVFNRIEFIATEYGDGRDTTGSGDSSDYFVQGVSATTMLSSYQTTEGDDLTLSVGDLLANDSDPNGDTFGFAGIVDVNGQLVTTGSAIVDANGATVTINGSTLTYNSGNQGLNVGETGSVDFTYRIEDANGATDDADVSLTVVGTQGSSGSLNLDGTSGDDILDGASGVDTFVWLDGESGTDTINNFEIGGPGVGDRLDLSDLLVGEENNPLSDYLSVSTNGTDTTIEIRPQGSGGSVEQTIVLDNVTGVTLQDLVNNDQIITD